MNENIAEACARLKRASWTQEFAEIEVELGRLNKRVDELAEEHRVSTENVWALLLESCGLRRKQ